MYKCIIYMVNIIDLYIDVPLSRWHDRYRLIASREMFPH